jgi:hypothetical protein
MNDDEKRVFTKPEFVFSNEQHEYGAVSEFASMSDSVSFTSECTYLL